MSELPMRGHFRYLRFKTFPMTPRTPQCQVFCPLLSSSEHSGVPEDSQPPTFPSVGLHPHTWPKWGCDIFQLLMAHSVWGFGGRFHSRHHFNRMINTSSRGQVFGQLFGHHIRELFQNSPYALGGSHLLGGFLGLILIQHSHDTHHAKTSHTFFFPSFSYHEVDGWPTHTRQLMCLHLNNPTFRWDPH